MAKASEPVEPEETDEIEEVEETDETDDSGDEEGWDRIRNIVDESVGKKLDEWAAKQKKMTSSNSPRKRVAKAPQRKQGFLSRQFFSNLNPNDPE